MKNNYFTAKGLIASCIIAMLALQTTAQSDYNVTAIPHQIYVAEAVAMPTLDDVYSQVIPIGFDFKFFGENYSQLVIGTNGDLRFDISKAGQNSGWNIGSTVPSADFITKNAIMGCLTDMRNSGANAIGSIKSAIIGHAPYRKYVVFFDNQPSYSCNANSMTSFQVILYESLNTIDIQIIQRQPCLPWNQGKGVSGIINSTGLVAFTPPNRNTGPWSATQEGWRYSLPLDNSVYNYTACATNGADFATFNLNVVRNDMGNPDLEFYATQTDALMAENPVVSPFYTNMVNSQTIYAAHNGVITEVILRAVDCTNDYDMDGVPTADEDLNGDGNLANDDTDGDGIPNFMDNDDDGDMVLTSFEYVFTSNPDDKSAMTILDTDGDGIPNYLDDDDDGDGILTKDEDANGNNNPMDDDSNGNGIPDYLDSPMLSTTQNSLSTLVSIYPNPTADVFFINNNSNQSVSNIAVYTMNGVLVKEIRNVADTSAIHVSDLQSGIYFVKLTVGESVINYKLIKK